MAASLLWDDDTTSGQKPQENSLQDLFVFGYACKLFRDDDKAKFIDEGRHLIPWMGDERLMIDRYDGRGHLYDLTRYDADLVKGTPVELTEEEKAVEAACDEERYLELVTDVQEKAMYEEEEWKRYYESLHEGTYNAVGFSYEQPRAPDTQPQREEAANEVEEEEAFVPPPELNVPEGITMPKTQKEHARIERTATFISKQGTQMEIVLKMRQANNVRFAFLDFDHPLNQYYQHLLNVIKAGKYHPKHQQEQMNAEQDLTDQHYLHPSLFTATITPLPPPPPPKPFVLPKYSIEDTSYGQLVSSLRKYHKPKEEEKRGMATPPLPPFMAQPDYGSNSTPLDTLPSSHGHAANNAPSVRPHTVKEERVEPPPPGTEVMGPLPQPASFNDVQGCENRSSPQPQIVPPPPDVQPIIDRMAMYVAKNGEEFELVVKSKNDQRFAFLEPDHVHFQYYDFKKNMFLKEAELKKRLEAKQAERERLKQEEEAAAAAAQANRSISFSIRGRNKEPESMNALKRPLFDYDSSEGEGEGEDGGKEVREKESKSRSISPDPGQAALMLPTCTSMSVAAPVTSEVKPVAAEDLEKKQAEERLKDKLATAARDKLAACTKEKQLQAERKKKAAMFINLLRIVKESPAPSAAGDKGKEEGETEVRSSPNMTPGCSKPPSPMPEVFEYNNRSGTPTILNQDLIKRRRHSRSKSPAAVSRKKRRKKSRTPPSAYANPLRSPPRFSSSQRHSPRRGIVVSRRMSPIRPFRSRRSPSPQGRDRSPLGRSRSPLRKKVISKRSRSRSQSPSQNKHKKKHKRSRSKTPKKKKKDKTSSGSRDRDPSKPGRSHDKPVDKHKDRDKKKDKDKKKERDKKEKERKDKDRKDKERKEKEKKDRKERDRHKSKDSDRHSSSRGSEKSREKGRDTASSEAKQHSSTVVAPPDPKPPNSASPLSAPKPDPESKAPLSPVPEVISSSSSESSSTSGDEGPEKEVGKEEGGQAGEGEEGGTLPQANGRKAGSHSGSQDGAEHVDLT